MNCRYQNSNKSTKIQELFHEDGNDYCIKSDCVFSDRNILTLNNIYELTSFVQDGIDLRYIKLKGVFLDNSELTLIMIDIQTAQVLKRCKDLSNDSYNKWLIVQPLYLSNELETKVQTYCERLTALNYCRNKYTEMSKLKFT